MGQPPNELTPAASPRHFWGAELRAHRTDRGLSLNDLGKLVHRDRSYLAKIEKGLRNIPADLANDCDRALHACGRLVRLHTVVIAGDGRQVIPGLHDDGHVATQGAHVASVSACGSSSQGLATPLGDNEEITVPARTADGRVIFVRVSRRLFLGGVGAAAASIMPLTSQTLVTASRVAGTADLNPLQHFIEMKKVLMDNDNFFGPARAISTVHQQIEIMEHLRHRWQGDDRLRLLKVQTQYADLLGWLYEDAGDFETAGQWVNKSLEWAHMARDSQTTAFALARKSQLAADMGNPADAVDAAEASQAIAQPATRISAIAATYAGHGHALGGDVDSSLRAYDKAREELSRAVDDDSAYGLFFNEGYLDVQRARSLTTLGRFLPANEVFQTAIDGLPEGYWRDRGVYLAWQARAYAGCREPEQAADLGLEALRVACGTGSARIISELGCLDSLLAHWAGVPKVEEFHTALIDVIPQRT
jgi:tetratricopeptide (TPR) repeat protein